MPPRRPVLPAVLLLALLAVSGAGGVEILAKSRVESCVLDSSAGRRLSCNKKLAVNMAVPTGSSGGEASLVAKVGEVMDNDTQSTGTARDPPVITISKTPTFALYDLTYLTDVAFRPEEQFVETRKCEPDAGGDVVKTCERLWYDNGSLIAHTEPVCCPCGPHRRVASSCGNFIDTIVKGKANTAHCLRFPGDWFHVWEIGTWSLGFSIRVQVKKGSSESEVVVSPENRTVVSRDNFLRVNIVGDFGGYTSIPSFENFYLVTPRKDAGSGQPQDIGDEYSKWMLLERVRFTLDHSECDKIGVGYEAFQNQPNFCTMPIGSCLHDQLWQFWEFDQTRINKNQPAQFVVPGRFQRINQHPNAGGRTFSIGVTEVINTNLLVELSVDDIEFVYQRSPGKIVGVDVSPFEALSQVGTAKVKIKNIGKLEASYSLTFHCSSGISPMGEQYYIMKPDEVINQSFSLRTSSDKPATYQCEAILKASDSSELDRAQCHFSTTATVFDNGTQVGSSNHHQRGGIWGFFDAIKALWRNFWASVIEFFKGEACRTKCSSLLDFSCHTQYICLGWLAMLFLLLTTLPVAAVLLWLLHQKGLFDPVYDWWDDLWGRERYDHEHPRHGKGHCHHHHHHHRRSHGRSNHPHAHQRHRGDEPSHHHVLHRNEVQQREAAAEGHRHRHDPALGVQRRDAGHRHQRRGKEVAAALRLDGPSQLRKTQEALELRSRYGYDYEARQAGHGLHDRDRHRSWEV